MPASRLAPLLWITFPLLGLASSCSEKSQADTKKEPEAEVIPVTELTARDTVLHHDYVADIESVRNVELRARVPGFLEKILVDEGEEVKAGQPLFRINASEYRAQTAKAVASVRSAQAQVQVARLELDRVQLLVDKKIIAPTELTVARSKLKAAEALVAEARSGQSTAGLNLSYTTIRAPFDGVVDRIPLKVGSLVDNGTLLTSVSDLRAVYAYFSVGEGEYLEYAKARQRGTGQRSDTVGLLLADGSAYDYPGKIETVEGEFEETTGSIAFRAQFPNPDKLLKHGASGRVRLSNTVHQAVLVPQKAVFEVQDHNYVFVVDGQGKIKQRSFKPQTRLSDFYVVKSGLRPGDRVVYEGVQDLREGATIRPRFISLNQLLAEAR